jgi:hypothetical protein
MHAEAWAHRDRISLPAELERLLSICADRDRA